MSRSQWIGSDLTGCNNAAITQAEICTSRDTKGPIARSADLFLQTDSWDLLGLWVSELTDLLDDKERK